jgi:hypothetical protein
MAARHSGFYASDQVNDREFLVDLIRVLSKKIYSILRLTFTCPVDSIDTDLTLNQIWYCIDFHLRRGAIPITLPSYYSHSLANTVKVDEVVLFDAILQVSCRMIKMKVCIDLSLLGWPYKFIQY